MRYLRRRFSNFGWVVGKGMLLRSRMCKVVVPGWMGGGFIGMDLVI